MAKKKFGKNAAAYAEISDVRSLSSLLGDCNYLVVKPLSNTATVVNDIGRSVVVLQFPANENLIIILKPGESKVTVDDFHQMVFFCS